MNSYFKKRKDNKRKMKNRRSENRMKTKMKFVKEKESLFSHTPIKEDLLGDITRLINKKGSVLSTETNMFRCEIDRNVPPFVSKFVDKIGLDVLIRVPIRTKGLTGSGNYRRCHSNVTGLVKRFGGKLLKGYYVSRGYVSNGELMCSFVCHSVWITPEGKCVDVTNNYDERDRSGMTEDSIIRKGDKEYILFVPVGIGRIEELEVGLNDVVLSNRWEKEGIYVFSNRPTIDGDNISDSFFLNKKKLEKFQNTTGVVETKKYHGFQNIVTCQENVKLLMEIGGFSQKSLGTGKNWDELKKEIVWN